MHGGCSEEAAGAALMKNKTENFQFHSDNLMKLRQKLTEHFEADIRQMSVLNQGNTQVDDSVDVFLTPMNTTKPFWNKLPKLSPFEDRMFETCSVVGSSDILTNRSCGRQIDKSDFVFRMNNAPYGEKYKEDVGSFANLTTLNGVLLNQRRGCQPETQRGQRLLFGNPRLVLQGNRFWRAFGFRGNMSSGS
ncbi:CMP-N-acetylneuraminate-poly-alpha-2,8-sialyltransferase-like [Diadema setosum]|uniref:CMP-N-acetylneuraminate-poly-alpha-2, 8-sialyltransferase-like n=1 Tax=Diadema setosum TaxID=31175 RepID=UPI003B3B73E7